MEYELSDGDDGSNKASQENSIDSILSGVHVTNRQHHGNIGCWSQKKNKLQAMRRKMISLSKAENTLAKIGNEQMPLCTSNVWQYALRCPDSNYSTCCLCPDNKKISTNNGSTSTLRKHLILKHKLNELALPNEKRKNKKSSIDTQRKQELHALCIYCIVRDGRSFNDFQKPGIKKLLQELIPGYEPPNRYMVSRHLKRLHIFHHKKLIDDLTHIDNISITLDFWSNRQMKCFLVITVDEEHTSYKISQLLQRKLKELDILHKIVRVTADGAKNIILALNDIGLGTKRIWCIAHRLHLTIINAFKFWIVNKEVSEAQELVDELPNDQEEMDDNEHLGHNDELDETNNDVLHAAELDEDDSSDECDIDDEESLPDVPDEQIMDNWLTDVTNSEKNYVADQETIASVIRKCRTLISMIKSSTILTSFFDRERGKLNIKRNLCYDVKSRWNSTYYMVDTILTLRIVIEQLFTQKHNLNIKLKQIKKLTSLELKSDDWLMLSALHTVLKPFFHATKVLSGRDYPSIGLAFYLLARLKSFLQRVEKKENILIKRLKQLVLLEFIYYFEGDDQQVWLLKFHSYFDPAGYMTLTECERNSIEADIKKMFDDDNINSKEAVTSTASTILITNKSAKEINVPRKSHKSVIDAFNESIGELECTETQYGEKKSDTIHDDIRSYRKYVAQFCSTHKMDGASSTLFWQTYAHSFPILAKLAKNYLSVPATSVPSESCFSMSSYLARKERARLTGDNLASSVFLKDKINY